MLRVEMKIAGKVVAFVDITNEGGPNDATVYAYEAQGGRSRVRGTVEHDRDAGAWALAAKVLADVVSK